MVKIGTPPICTALPPLMIAPSPVCSIARKRVPAGRHRPSSLPIGASGATVLPSGFPLYRSLRVRVLIDIAPADLRRLVDHGDRCAGLQATLTGNPVLDVERAQNRVDEIGDGFRNDIADASVQLDDERCPVASEHSNGR